MRITFLKLTKSLPVPIIGKPHQASPKRTPSFRAASSRLFGAIARQPGDRESRSKAPFGARRVGGIKLRRIDTAGFETSGVAQLLEDGRKRSANPQKSVLQFSCNSIRPGPRIDVSHPRRNALVSAGAPGPPQRRNLADRPKGCPADRREIRPRGPCGGPGSAIGGFPATLAGSLPATPTRGLPHGTAPASRATMSEGPTPAIGGRPGSGLVDCGPGYSLPPDQFAASPYGRWQASIETMLATRARKDDPAQRDGGRNGDPGIDRRATPITPGTLLGTWRSPHLVLQEPRSTNGRELLNDSSLTREWA